MQNQNMYKKYGKHSLRLCMAFMLILTLCMQGAMALTSPKAALQVSIDEMLVYLQKPAYADPSTRPPLRQAIEEEIYGIFDFARFSQGAVGTHWKRFTPENKAQLSDAFAELLIATYLDTFEEYLDEIEEYSGEEIDYVNELISKKGDRAEVRTILTLADDTKVPMAYRMILKDNSWVVYDVLIENASLIKNYRLQFSSILQQGSPEELIARIVESTQALQAEASMKE